MTWHLSDTSGWISVEGMFEVFCHKIFLKGQQHAEYLQYTCIKQEVALVNIMKTDHSTHCFISL